MNVQAVGEDKIKLSLNANRERWYLRPLIAAELGWLARAAFWVRMTWSENLEEEPLEVAMHTERLSELRLAIEGRIEGLVPEDPGGIGGTEEQITFQLASLSIREFMKLAGFIEVEVPHVIGATSDYQSSEPEMAA